MVVNSLNFLLFFVVVFVVYYLPVSRNSPKFQNTWLFVTSYFFYGFADRKMIALLLGATIVFYGIGLWLKSEMEKRHTKNASNITTLGVVLGIGVLFYFKYLNFFADSFAQLLNAIGLNVSWSTLNIVLPIGVSFFTFKLISYVIEVHREHIQPSKDFIEFGAYISFFPTILSGPIDRPNKFIPQLGNARRFDYHLAVKGVYLVLWGLFMKMCIADNLAVCIDPVILNIHNYNAQDLLRGFLFYPLQLYTDFAGYSNMAIGVGALLGLKVSQNFNYPFIGRNIAEYWRRWHMSLTSFITDYVFMPLNIAFRSYGNFGIIMAVAINLIIIGFWHGANWTYGLFGLYHGLLFVPLVFSGAFGKHKKIKANKYGLLPIKDVFMMMLTYILVAIGNTIFRAPDVYSAFLYMTSMFDWSVLNKASGNYDTFQIGVFCLLLLLLKEYVEVFHPKFKIMESNSVLLKYVWVLTLFTIWILTQNEDTSQFIYFNF